MKVAILYDGGADDWTPEDVRAVRASVTATREALERGGHEVEEVAVDAELAWLERARPADVVFNLCEGIGGLSRMEYKVASAVELLGLPMTGASAWTMTICHRKPVLNAVLAAHALPIPRWTIPTADDALDDFPLPAIVKPAEEDASVGVDQNAVLASHADLRDQVARIRDRFGRVMVQQYVAGREVAVAFVGNAMLPLSEIDFSAMPDDHWPIVTFDAKWNPGSDDYKGTVPRCPADMAADLAASAIAVAKDAWRAVGGHGYGRIDLRIDADGRPWILEVNPNPDTTPDAGLANMARAHGWSYDELVYGILEAALSPTRQPSASAGVGQ